MKFRFLTVLLVVLCWAEVMHLPRVSAQSSPASVRAGVYTKEQATRGQQKYASTCAACHGDDLAGLEMAPSLTGPDFDSNWSKQPLSALVTKIRTMPPTDPNSLPRPEIVDLVAYILSANGLPAGDSPLSEDNSVLSGLIYEPASASH